MITLRATLELHTAFGTPLAGDTLFGQLCWSAREHLGNTALTQLLDGYTAGRPWLVVSDGFPAGYLPRPTVPASLSANSCGTSGYVKKNEDAHHRKAEKAKHWIPCVEIDKPLPLMLAAAVNDKIAFGDDKKPVEAPQPHNTLNRLTGTTGEGEFAPYTQPQIFFARGQCMDVYCVLDESKLSLDQFTSLLQAVGNHGYGRDASIGLGKYSVKSVDANSLVQHSQANAYLTLAPCAPQGQGYDGTQSYWRVLTRFGRHGNLHGISEKPFKNPVLLAAAGAVFVPQAEYAPLPFIGQGLGGNGQLSKIEPATVHQGYAPVVGIKMEM